MDWTVLETYDNTALADMNAERLNNSGVPTRVDYGAYRSGVDGVRLYVPRELVDRARSLLNDKVLTDAQLTRAALADGETPDTDG